MTIKCKILTTKEELGIITKEAFYEVKDEECYKPAVVKVDEGEVRDFGKHDQLMNRDGGIYKKIYESFKGEKNVIRN